MKKHNKHIFRFLKIPAIAISLVCLVACGNRVSRIIPFDSTVAYTKVELIDLYWEHKDELNKVAEIILASDSLLQEIIDNRDVERDVNNSSQKKHFSEDDWEKIVNLYENIRPLTIERELYGAVGIYFGRQKVDKDYVSYSLRYFRNDVTLEYYKYQHFRYRWEKDFEHIDGYWYIRTRIIPR